MKDLKKTSGRKASKSKHNIEDARVIEGRKKEKKGLKLQISEETKKLVITAIRYGIVRTLYKVCESPEEVLNFLFNMFS
ncbi:hypothetical protein [Pseudomonas citronellolis]|uniref:hypothetical protein n=1 Tax=Pseudomonas citronellolis TaxID=53408 RepID=UPI00209CF11E|nr:hypothetical protein [Pseudomonas citronellolis]MCP1602673.1 hypothetical protein [Pseudomonas citronellolis]MCP1653731.1 hypothetical protein [Pseudomonas citronellolis]MCP1720676.1 hypothetical protein [Pseudomonas citronellolis]